MPGKLKAFAMAAAAALALSATSAAAQPKTFLTIGSGSTTGLYYPTAVGMAKIINEAGIDLRANARSTGGSVFNAKAIEQGQLQMGLMQNNIAQYAHRGQGVQAFEGSPIKSLRGVVALYPEVVHIVARADAGIETPADLKGKRVYVGDVGSGTEQDARQILGAHDVELTDLQSPVRGSASDAVNLLRDGRIEAMFYTVGVGSSAITEVAQTAPIKIVGIEQEKLEALKSEYAFYTPFTIPAGTYPKMDSEATTVTLKAMLAADQSLPADAVYQFCQTLFGDNLQAFYDDIQNPNLKKYFTVKAGLEGMSIPLHEGAARFFREQGVEIPESLKPEGGSG